MFKFKVQTYYKREVLFELKFYKVCNKKLFYIQIKDIDDLCLCEYSYGIALLSKFTKMENEELKSYLKNNYKNIIYKNKICFYEFELNKIIDWLESIKIMNKLENLK